MCSSAVPLSSSSGAARTRSGTVLSRVMLALPLPSCVISGEPPDLSVCSSERKTTNAYLSGLSVVRITRNHGGGMPAMPSTQEASLPAGSSPCPHLLSFRRRRAGRPAQRWGPSERSSPCPPPHACLLETHYSFPFVHISNDQLKWLSHQRRRPDMICPASPLSSPRRRGLCLV